MVSWQAWLWPVFLGSLVVQQCMSQEFLILLQVRGPMFLPLRGKLRKQAEQE